mgnify:CR=1 FL=1
MFCILALFTVLVPVNGSSSLPHGVLCFRAPLSPLCGFSACGFNGKGLHGLVVYQVFLIGLTPTNTAFTNRFRSSSSALRFPKSEIQSFLTVTNIIIIYYIHSNRSTIFNQQHHFIDQSTTSFHRYSPGDHSRLQVLLCGHEQ